MFLPLKTMLNLTMLDDITGTFLWPALERKNIARFLKSSLGQSCRLYSPIKLTLQTLTVTNFFCICSKSSSCNCHQGLFMVYKERNLLSPC